MNFCATHRHEMKLNNNKKKIYSFQKDAAAVDKDQHFIFSL